MNKFLDFCVEYLPEPIYRFVFRLLPKKYFIRWKAWCFYGRKSESKEKSAKDIVRETNEKRDLGL